MTVGNSSGMGTTIIHTMVIITLVVATADMVVEDQTTILIFNCQIVIRNKLHYNLPALLEQDLLMLQLTVIMLSFHIDMCYIAAIEINSYSSVFHNQCNYLIIIFAP